MGKALIKVLNLSKSFKNHLIFENLNLNIYENDIMGLVGLSGSGKSTLLKIICGFVRPDEGSILNVQTGDDLFKNNVKIKSLIGFSAQDPSIYYTLSVKDNLKYFGSIENMEFDEIEKRIEEVLEILDLKELKKVFAKDLSEGQKKRLDIGCAIMDNPKILILDEPTSNLDYKLRKELLEYMKKINKCGTTIIFVSHDLNEIKKICSRVAILKDKTLNVELIQNVTNLRSYF